MILKSINFEQRLYVIAAGQGFSCYGFDVLDKKARAVAEWCGQSYPLRPIGTPAHFEECSFILKTGAHYAMRTGKRCDADLIPALIGLEGKRVEVVTPSGIRTKFRVGKSTGWMPCHLQLALRGKSDGGPAAYVPEGSTVKVLT